MYNFPPDTKSIYIHWPFCPYKCHFCPFVALASHDSFMSQYHQALKQEVIRATEHLSQKADLETIYFGGGTPSTYPDELLLDTFGILRSVFNFNPSSEVTIELNPGTIRPEQLGLWKELGINRLSVGVQSLNDAVLKKLNRHQKAEDVFFVLDHAKDIFENISVDLILGLPGVSAAEWKELIKKVVTWPIKHVSMYFLSVHENTLLYFNVKKKRVTLPCDDETVDLYYWSIDELKKFGFEQYEISNFALPGYESRHNRMYWQRKPYRGFGLGACSFDGTVRYQNEKNLMNYMQGIEQRKDVVSFSERLLPEQIYLEKIMLGLRQTAGITRNDILGGHSNEQKILLQKQIAQLEQRKLVVVRDDRLQLTPAGLAVENEIVVKLSL